ncbi:MAG: DUF1275 domain-containing protein [Proteobacteria bacterium]|nr:MAG: DUF1275 domain-containing protein [Pseudomonadota bacterium]
MYRLEREDFVRPRYIALWALLAFQAGFINTFGYFALGRSVSHVTGFGTQIGIALAESRLLIAVDLLMFPLFFVLGSFVSALYTSARIERSRRPSYGRITLAMPIILFTLMAMGSFGVFGPFGEEFIYNRDFALLFLLAFFCGMQNGCFATMTKGQVRTTHLTGVSTDLGTDAARMFFGRLEEEEYALTQRVQISRLATIVCFASGSILSAQISSVYGYTVLALPFATSAVAYLAARQTSRLLDERLESNIAEERRARSAIPHPRRV